jgi:hypothetical protein
MSPGDQWCSKMTFPRGAGRLNPELKCTGKKGSPCGAAWSSDAFIFGEISIAVAMPVDGLD